MRLFETFYSSEINLLARAIETVQFNDKDCIYRQGDPGDFYYLILKGRTSSGVAAEDVRVAGGPGRGVKERADGAGGGG